ncbi:MAG: methyltransferase domain-containing protein [Actinomycetota bacterium]|nr:methyltransferase domain-containing protein [Actinomycetota bacterium]
MKFKAEMFNRKAADPENKPDQVIEALKLQRGNQVADIGSGGGYYTFRFAQIVGKQGKVYAVDTNSQLLEHVESTGRQKGLTNVSTVLTGEGKLPSSGIDCIFMRNVTHHLKDRVEFFKDLKKYLKPEGRVAIIDYSCQHKSLRTRKHYIARDTIITEMLAAGFRLEEEYGWLKNQHFTIYRMR